jgi:hypothetical protein
MLRSAVAELVGTKSTTTSSIQEYLVAVMLMKEMPIEIRNMSGIARPRMLNMRIVLGSVSTLTNRGFPGTYHHTKLSSSLVAARLPA